jgi:hypothetical protein
MQQVGGALPVELSAGSRAAGNSGLRTAVLLGRRTAGSSSTRSPSGRLPATALSVAFVYLAARDLSRREGVGESAALMTAAVYALATPTGPSRARDCGATPRAAGLAACLWALLRSEASRADCPRRLARGSHGGEPPLRGVVAMVIAGYAVLSSGRAGLLCGGALGAVLATWPHTTSTVFGSLQGGYSELHRTHAEHHGVASAWGGSIGAGLAGVLVSRAAASSSTRPCSCSRWRGSWPGSSGGVAGCSCAQRSPPPSASRPSRSSRSGGWALVRPASPRRRSPGSGARPGAHLAHDPPAGARARAVHPGLRRLGPGGGRGSLLLPLAPRRGLGHQPAGRRFRPRTPLDWRDSQLCDWSATVRRAPGSGPRPDSTGPGGLRRLPGRGSLDPRRGSA